MDFEGTDTQVEELLKCFLIGTQNVALAAQILAIEELPAAWRERVRKAESLGRAWVAWSTDRGPMVAWGKYDVEGSMRHRAEHALFFVEWYVPPCEYHALWCHCSPKRPTEWTVGRGILEDVH